MQLTDRILVRLLAQRDAIFAPVRRFDGPRGANVYLARERYHVDGLPWTSGKAAAIERKRSQTALEILAGKGHVVTFAANGRTFGARLTDRGELRAACLADVPAIIDPGPWAIFEALKRRGKHWTPEDDLLPTWKAAYRPRGADWTRELCLAFLGDALLPFLCRLWVESGSTIHGNARYRLGERAEEATRPTRTATEFSVELRDAGNALYRDSYDVAFLSLDSTTTEDTSELGILPLPEAAADADELRAWKRSRRLAAQGQ